MTFSGLASGLFLGALLAVFLAVALIAEDGAQRGNARSFYFEARVEVPEAADGDILGEVKGWYEAPGRWRYEFASTEPARAHESVIQVSDGRRYWLYRGETNTYITGDARQYLANFGLTETDAPPPPSFGLLLGPAPLGNAEAYLQALVEAGNITLSSRSWERTVGGRPADRFDTHGQDGRMSSVWVDRDYDFILRSETPYASSSPAARDPGTLQAEVLMVEFNEEIDDAIFAFQPPADSREELPDGGTSVGSGSSGSLGEGVPPPEGFLAVTAVPEGLEATRHEQSGTNQGITSYGVTYESPDGSAWLQVEQTMRAGGLADSQRAGEAIDVAGTTGYLTGDGPMLTLTWARGDLVIRLTTVGLEREELLRVAESMRP